MFCAVVVGYVDGVFNIVRAVVGIVVFVSYIVDHFCKFVALQYQMNNHESTVLKITVVEMLVIYPYVSCLSIYTKH